MPRKRKEEQRGMLIIGNKKYTVRIRYDPYNKEHYAVLTKTQMRNILKNFGPWLIRKIGRFDAQYDGWMMDEERAFRPVKSLTGILHDLDLPSTRVEFYPREGVFKLWNLALFDYDLKPASVVPKLVF